MTAVGVRGNILAAQNGLGDHLAKIPVAEARIKKLERQIATDKRAFDLLVDQISSRNVAATIADEPLPAEDPTERARLQTLRARIDASTSALPQLQDALTALIKETANLESHVADAFWPWKVDVLDREMTAVQAALSSAAPALAALAALDGVQAELVGQRFVTTTENRLATVSSERIVAKFLAAIPERLRPSELSGPAFQALAERAADELHASLKGQDQ